MGKRHGRAAKPQAELRAGVAVIQPPPAGSAASRLARTDSRQALAITLGLVLAVFAVFGRMLTHDFVYYDTQNYVIDNAILNHAPLGAFLRWAFTTDYACYWMPLTWLTHRLDCQLYGLHPWGHLLTNLCIHAANAALLFYALRRMTGATWRSACVAALFAVHPLRAESVAWVAERKDLLSAFFWILTLAAYDRFARGPFAIKRYLALLATLVLGLMCKPSVVTLPCVLLLLDLWPLRRWPAAAATGVRGPDAPRQAPLARLIAEKLPLLLIAIIVSIATYRSQAAKEAVMALPLTVRLANVWVNYLEYLEKFLCPVSLSVLYPYSETYPPALKLAAALLVVGGATACALLAWRRRPHLTVGWLWFLGVLLPMAGLIQVYIASIADRYTYLSQIGLAICAVWGAAELAEHYAVRPRTLAWAVGTVLAALMALCARQVGVWRNDVTLWTQAMQNTANNDYAVNNLALAYHRIGDHASARKYYLKAIGMNPANWESHANLGRMLEGEGDFAGALEHFRAAAARRTSEPLFHIKAGNALLALRRLDEAEAELQRALQLNAADPMIHATLGAVRLAAGDPKRATESYRKALELDPRCIKAHFDLGMIAAMGQDFKTALQCFGQAAALQPADPTPPYQMGRVYAAMGDKARAVEQYRAALTLAQRAGDSALAGEIAQQLQQP